MTLLKVDMHHCHKPDQLSHVLLGIIPRNWRRYNVPAGLTVIQWVTDFSDRIKQLQEISQKVGGHSSKVLKVALNKFW